MVAAWMRALTAWTCPWHQAAMSVKALGGLSQSPARRRAAQRPAMLFHRPLLCGALHQFLYFEVPRLEKKRKSPLPCNIAYARHYECLMAALPFRVLYRKPIEDNAEAHSLPASRGGGGLGQTR